MEINPYKTSVVAYAGWRNINSVGVISLIPIAWHTISYLGCILSQKLIDQITSLIPNFKVHNIASQADCDSHRDYIKSNILITLIPFAVAFFLEIQRSRSYVAYKAFWLNHPRS